MGGDTGCKPVIVHTNVWLIDNKLPGVGSVTIRCFKAIFFLVACILGFNIAKVLI